MENNTCKQCGVFVAPQEEFCPNCGASNPKDRWQQPADGAKEDLKQTIANYNSYSTYRMFNSYEILDRLKAGVGTAVEEADRGFRNASWMYKITFAVGIILIGAAFISAYATGGSIQTVLFGASGTLDIVAFFLKDPPLRLQQNRAELAKLKAAYYGWFLDTENWIQLIYELSIDGKSNLSVADMKQASDTIAANTQKFMGVFPTDQGQQPSQGKQKTD
jgi:hypothetical protein